MPLNLEEGKPKEPGRVVVRYLRWSATLTLAPNLVIAAFILAVAPASAIAQTWPGIAVASAPALSQIRPSLGALTQSRPRPSPHAFALNLKIRKAEPAQTVPDFDVHAKPEWSDDQGFRISLTRVAFKTRF